MEKLQGDRRSRGTPSNRRQCAKAKFRASVVNTHVASCHKDADRIDLTAIQGTAQHSWLKPLILRVKRAREEDATPETLVVAAPPSKRRTLDQSLAALSTEQPQNVLHRFRKLENAPVSGYAEAAARKLALQALKDRKKRRRAHEDAKPQETKRAALRAVDANGCLDLVLDDAEPKLPRRRRRPRPRKEMPCCRPWPVD